MSIDLNKKPNTYRIVVAWDISEKTNAELVDAANRIVSQGRVTEWSNVLRHLPRGKGMPLHRHHSSRAFMRWVKPRYGYVDCIQLGNKLINDRFVNVLRANVQLNRRGVRLLNEHKTLWISPGYQTRWDSATNVIVMERIVDFVLTPTPRVRLPQCANGIKL